MQLKFGIGRAVAHSLDQHICRSSESWAVPACWRWEWLKFGSNSDLALSKVLSPQFSRIASLWIFFSYCYSSFRCSGLSNSFMHIADWVQTITFFLKLLIHINYFFFPKCTSSWILWQKPVTEFCFISIVKKSALSMLLFYGSWSGPPKIGVFSLWSLCVSQAVPLPF